MRSPVHESRNRKLKHRVQNCKKRKVFGFNCKEKADRTAPTGETEFQFKEGNLNFHSEAYESLSISGAKATFRGTGTVNGNGRYRFMVTVIDAQSSKVDAFTTDRFRIRI